MVPVKLYALVAAGEPVQIAVEDEDGHVAKAEGPVPEAARKISLAREQVEEQIGKTGGTPYRCERALAQVDPGLSLPCPVPQRPTLHRPGRPDRPAHRPAGTPSGRLPPRRPLHENRKTEPSSPPLPPQRRGPVPKELLDCHPHSVSLPLGRVDCSSELVETILRAGVEAKLWSCLGCSGEAFGDGTAPAPAPRFGARDRLREHPGPVSGWHSGTTTTAAATSAWGSTTLRASGSTNGWG